MTEHNICKGCKWNKYPICDGTIIDGIEMNIENLNKGFKCGIKEKNDPVNIKKFPIPEKSTLELRIEELEQKNQDLENRIEQLEEKILSSTKK